MYKKDEVVKLFQWGSVHPNKIYQILKKQSSYGNIDSHEVLINKYFFQKIYWKNKIFANKRSKQVNHEIIVRKKSKL